MTVVLLDVDGVIADFTGAVCTLATLHANKRFKPEHVTQWSIKDALELDDATWQKITEQISSPGFVRTLKPYDGAVEGVKRIARIADVYFVTSHWWSSTTWTHDRETWLQYFFGQTLGRRVFHTHHKDRVHGDVFVDDKPAHGKAWMRRWPGTAVLWKRPYNDGHPEFHYRTNDWQSLLEIVQDCA